MSRTENTEFRSGKQFNRAECVRHTARTFTPYAFTLGQSIEPRYIAGFERQNVAFWRSRYLDAFVAQRVGQFQDPGVELTDARLNEFDIEEEQARKKWGPTVLSYANQLGLADELTSEQAVGRLHINIRPYATLTEVLDQRQGLFSYRGWDILAGEKDNPILLVPNESEEGQIYFGVVRLDDLNGKDSDFLVQQIQSYQEKYAMHALANSISYSLRLHQVPEATILPRYIRDVAKITDSERRVREIQAMGEYMGWISGLGHDYTNIVYNFKQELGKGMKMGEDRWVDIKSYLTHMVECPARTAKDRQKSTAMTQLYNALLSEQQEPSFDLHINPSVIRVLREPDQYTFYLDGAEERNSVDKEQDQKVIDFIDKTKDITDQAQLLEMLQQELPDFHATVVRFQGWLGSDYLGRSKFDELISRTARNIYLADRKFNIEDLNRAFRKTLRSEAYFLKGEFEGVYIDYYRSDEEALLSNLHLEAVLPLMVIKGSQAEADSKKEERYMGDHYARQVQRAKRLTEELAESYRKRVQGIDHALQRIAKDKRDVTFLKGQTGITDEEIAHLIELTKMEGDRFRPWRIDDHLYTGLFNALVLSKKGIVDIQSPAFRGFLKALFPNRPKKVWQNLT